MKRSVALLATVSVAAFSQSPNPFLAAWQTPFDVPDFRLVKNEHFVPAFREGMAQHKQEILSIVESKEAPTFKNTIEAMDISGQFMERVSAMFGALRSNETTPALQSLQRELMPLLSAHGDDISFNKDLWLRVKAVWENRDKETLNPEQKRLLEKRYKSFVRSGANLKPEQQKRMREINAEQSRLGVDFSERLLNATKAFQLFIDKREDLDGLPEGLIQAAAQAAEAAGKKGQWLFTLDNPSRLPFMHYAKKRELRKKMLLGHTERCLGGAFDTCSIVSRIAALRQEKARLLGYETWAHFVLEENMAKNSKGVYGLLDQLWTPALAVAKKDRAEMQVMLEKDLPGQKLQAWDWVYYEEKVRKAKFDLDNEALKPYFSLDNVREGAFAVVGKLYGITFHERKDLPTWHPEVRTWEVKEKDGAHLGLFYGDYHPRPGKQGGAWSSGLRSARDRGKVTPIVTNTCNFTRPVGDVPALLALEEVETLFHEFGHALHSLFYKGQYRGTAGTPRDFVELPSQIMENWATEPQVLKMYAKHYKTGEPIPDALIQKIRSARTYGQGYKTVEYLAASLLDMRWHTLGDGKEKDAMKFEETTLAQLGLLPEIFPRYRTPYFDHIWAGGYSAGYYAYIWSEVLDCDAFNAFVEKNDLFHPTTAAAFRKEILEMGGNLDSEILYLNFRGRAPKVDALLMKRGFK